MGLRLDTAKIYTLMVSTIWHTCEFINGAGESHQTFIPKFYLNNLMESPNATAEQRELVQAILDSDDYHVEVTLYKSGAVDVIEQERYLTAHRAHNKRA